GPASANPPRPVHHPFTTPPQHGSRTDELSKGEEMRRATVIVVALLVALAGVAIGVGAYHAGLTNGLDQAGHAERVVRVVGPGYGFPFGLLLFPLFLLAFFALARTARWGRRWAG